MDNRSLFEFIAQCPTAYHTTDTVCRVLTAAGFVSLSEATPWTLQAGQGYFVTRGASSVIAFRAPQNFGGFIVAAAHGDSPAPKIKENAVLRSAEYARLSIEPYGGIIFSSWMDRPLSVAGRVIVRQERHGFAICVCPWL